MVSKFKFYLDRTWAEWNSWFGLPLFFNLGPRLRWIWLFINARSSAVGFGYISIRVLLIYFWPTKSHLVTLKPIIVQQPWLRYWKPLGVVSLSDYHNHWILQKSTLASSLVECIYIQHHCFHTTVVTQKLIFSEFLHYFIFTLNN